MPHSLTTAWRRKIIFGKTWIGYIKTGEASSRCGPKRTCGRKNIGDEEIMGKYGVGTRNKEGSMVVGFGKRMNLALVNTYFKKKDKHRVTYKSGRKVKKSKKEE